MSTIIKFDVSQYLTNVGGHDPENEWSRDSYTGYCEIDEARIVKEDRYNCLAIDEDLKVGDIIYLVWAEYTTGNSFGRDGGQYELLEVFTDEMKANSRIEYWESVSDYSVPWTGYFEHLDGVYVTPLILEGDYE